MTPSPKVTVILTSHNHEKYIGEAIESVLRQTFVDFELLIWDDASTDSSWAIIQSYHDARIKSFRNSINERGGLINKALRSGEVRGEYVAIHHSDDAWEPEKLQRQVAFLDCHPAYGAVFSDVLAIGEDGQPLNNPDHFYSGIFNQPNRSRQEWLNHFFYKGNALCHPSVLIRKQCYKDCGLYRHGLAQLGDLDMWIRLCMKYEIHVLPLKLVRFRVLNHGANSSGGRPETRIRIPVELYAILNNYLEIEEPEEFFKIFPDAKKYSCPEGFESKFIFSMVTLEENSPPWAKLFGINLLWNLLNNEVDAYTIKSLYGFTPKNFMEISAHHDIFSVTKFEQLQEQSDTLQEQSDTLQIQIDALKNLTSDYRSQLNELQIVLSEREHQIANLQAEKTALLSSKSWRMTRPLRAARHLLNKSQATIEMEHIIRRLYRWLPLSQSTKTRIKNNVFKWSGSVLAKTVAYQSWSQAYATEITAREVDVISPEGHGTNSTPLLPLSRYVKGILSQPLTGAMDDYVEISDQPCDTDRVGARAIAFYLPQFHPIPENDKWWGKGFTEWTNVSKAVPQFIGHYQPHLPGELGFYDLRVLDVMRRQAELAKLYGIEGFCFYYYWFGGRRLLERPLEQLLSSDINLPFCICWANENWTRRWDGMDGEVLMEQNYGPEDDLAFIESLEPYLRDKRYIRVNGKPLLILYRPSLLPDARATLERWRNFCREVGIGEIFIGMVQFDELDPRKYGFDTAIEFPPHKLGSGLPAINNQLEIVNANYAGCVVDYEGFIEKSVTEKAPDYHLVKGVVPSWDNEARKPGRGYTIANSSPDKYRAWLRSAVKFAASHPVEGEKLVFINAWNEWAEGAHLEPDRRYGYAYLEATKQALLLPKPTSTPIERVCIVIHAFYPELLGEMLNYLKDWTIPYRLILTTTPAKRSAVETELRLQNVDAEIRVSENRGRDILPFLNVLPSVIPAREIILKLHTKRSLHRVDGEKWRKDLLHKLLNPQIALRIYNEFQRSPDLGMVGPEGHILSMNAYWGTNANNVRKLMKRMGIQSSPTSGCFAAGSMFYARPEAFESIADLNLQETDFEQEAGQVDGTLAHAIERCFSMSTWASGYYLASCDKPDVPVFRAARIYEHATPSH